MEKFITFLKVLSEPYFDDSQDLDKGKIATISLVLLLISIIRVLLESGTTIEIFITFLILYTFFGIGAVIDSIIKTKFIQFGWLIVFYLIFF